MNKLDKIRKLLAMTQSDNANEAEVARALADQLMAAAGVTEDDIRPDADPVSTVRAERSGPIASAGWKSVAAHAVARIVGCYGYRETIYHGGKRIVVRVWIGTDEQRETAAELLAWVIRQIDRLAAGAAKIAKGHAHPRAFMNAYRVGVASAIAAKAMELVEYRKAHRPQGPGLVLASQIDAAIAKLKPSGHDKGGRSLSVMDIGGAFTSGRAAGASVALRRDVAAPSALRLRSGS